jgi:hypothetical protein
VCVCVCVCVKFFGGHFAHDAKPGQDSSLRAYVMSWPSTSRAYLRKIPARLYLVVVALCNFRCTRSQILAFACDHCLAVLVVQPPALATTANADSHNLTAKNGSYQCCPR